MNTAQIEQPQLAIEVHHLTVAYQHSPVLWGVDFGLPTGSMTAIVGPNGAGKSSLLKAIMGLIPIVSGNISILDASIDQRRALVAYVPQKEEVDWDFPITVKEVVIMGRASRLPFYRKPSVNDQNVANDAMLQLGLTELAERQIRELSGGQQQRVFLARALTQEAQIYLLDEPFAGIDATTEATIAKLLRQLVSQGKTVLCVHHDLSTVKEYFDRVVLLNLRLIASGLVTEVFAPEKIQQTYSGRLKLLDEVGERLRIKQWQKR